MILQKLKNGLTAVRQIISVLCIATLLYAQKDSLNPQKALMWSLLLPGAGQFYNHSYWKIPVVYAAIGGAVGFMLWNQRNYEHFRQAYKAKIDNDPATQDIYPNVPAELLRAQRDYYRRNRDLGILLIGIAYALNAMEAYVDAHLKYFDVSEEVYIQWYPAAIRLCWRFGAKDKRGNG